MLGNLFECTAITILKIRKIMCILYTLSHANAGEFGLVYKGYLSSAVGRELVAVKTLKGMNKSFNTCNHWSSACTTLSLCQALVKSILFVALLRCIHVQHYHIYL